MFDQFNGMRVIADPTMTETVPNPRSPGRARRRAKKYPQHYVTRPKRDLQILDGNTIVGHPATIAALRAEAAAVEALRSEVEKNVERYRSGTINLSDHLMPHPLPNAVVMFGL